MNFIKLFNDGGTVMYPLLAASILMVTLACERLFFWLNIGSRQKKLINIVFDLYQNNSNLVMDKLERERDLPLARVFAAAIGLKDANPEEFRLAMESEVHAEMPLLRRFINVFDAIIGLAPLLGLLGTVTGLITSFSSLKLGQALGGGSDNVVGGISEALVSTATGVIVAIVASVFANVFRSFYQRQIYQIQESTGQLELLHRRLWERDKYSSR
jgi:biopolymer transport protein ExbB